MGHAASFASDQALRAWMPKHPERLRIAILAAQFHATITEALLQGARELLEQAGVSADHIRVVQVPGAFELPVVAARLAKGRSRPDAMIAVGALIQGETAQYEVLAHAVAGGLMQVAVSTGIPVTFGVIVAESLAQANARAGGMQGNRGAEAAIAALAALAAGETTDA